MSPSICARAAMPCLNGSENVAREASSTPMARKPLNVKATLTHFISLSLSAITVFAFPMVGIKAAIHLRAPSAFWNVIKLY